VVLAAMACLAACKPVDSKVPRLAATVGQLGAASEFLTFIDRHQRQSVALDLQFPRDSFQTTEDARSSSFDVWEDCDNLPEGQKPGALYGCTGFEFIVPHPQGTPAALVQDGPVWRLRGTFRAESAGGPLQGLMIVRLTPMSR
jgi:hypothetical protein